MYKNISLPMSVFPHVRTVLLGAVMLSLAFMLSACGDSEIERPTVNGATAATFEYADEADNGYKLITSEIATLYTFDTLDIVPAQQETPFDWVYRMTINPEEVVHGGDEIIILFGEEQMSIDGVPFTSGDGVDYADVLNWAANKYSYFAYELQQ